ncbi:MAG TPA: aminotransferase class IV [Gemmatimonadales bacterium]|nr:aminotransferase class IV [Gemmatimonadales bacterium]
MVVLQRPPYVWMGGRLTEWDQATIHVGSEALIRGISVFEGIKGYWRHDGAELSLLALREHYDRLTRSALLQHLPFATPYEGFRDACATLVRKLMTKERDLWLRPTLFAVEGHWGLDTVTDLVITCYNQDKKKPEPIEIGVSTWQRPLDTGLPTRVKSAANYQISRLARIEGRRQGCDDMILLNQWGRVAEATGSCVLMVRNGRVATPPPHEGCLESITVNIVEALCGTLGIPFERRPIDRTELMVADEVALAGTLMELGVVKRLDFRAMPAATPVLGRITDEYWACVRGQKRHPAVQLTPV